MTDQIRKYVLYDRLEISSRFFDDSKLSVCYNKYRKKLDDFDFPVVIKNKSVVYK